MNVVFHVFLYWSAAAGLVFSFIMGEDLLGNPKSPAWHRVIYCFLIGPTVWLVVLAMMIMATIGHIAQSERARRAKKNPS